MATQTGETVPFVEELLKQLQATVSDLETHQVGVWGCRFLVFLPTGGGSVDTLQGLIKQNL